MGKNEPEALQSPVGQASQGNLVRRDRQAGEPRMPAREDPRLVVLICIVLICIVLDAVSVGISLCSLSPMRFLFCKSHPPHPALVFLLNCLFPTRSTPPGEPDS